MLQCPSLLALVVEERNEIENVMREIRAQVAGGNSDNDGESEPDFAVSDLYAGAVPAPRKPVGDADKLANYIDQLLSRIAGWEDVVLHHPLLLVVSWAVGLGLHAAGLVM